MITDFIRIIFRHSLKHPLRTVLTALGIAIALFAFALIRTLIGAWYAGVEASAKNRLVVRNSVSLVFYLPRSYGEAISKVPGVKNVGYGNWFGGIYKDERFRFQQFAVDENYMDIHPEFIITPAERAAWSANRKGVFVGQQLAENFGLKVGDVAQLKGTIFPGLWELNVEGIFQGRNENTDTRLMLFHWDYLNERNKAEIQREPDKVGFYGVELTPDANPAAVSKAIDALFANSYSETLTETETAFVQSFVSMSSTIIATLRIVSGVVLVIMLLVLANTMLMSFRDRLQEYSILKAIGFQPNNLLWLILGEAFFLVFAGLLVLGTMLAPVMLLPPRKFLGDLVNFFPVFQVSVSTLIIIFVVAIAVALLASIVPIRNMSKLRITEGLRKLG